MGTPHIAAEAKDFAPAVLMPGDPKRAERMAGAILAQARLVTDVRGILGFTGVYAGEGEHQGKPLSIMASGMGMPSIGIYATELFRFFGVERIVRVGTAGGISPKVDVGDAIIGVGAHTTSSMNELRIPGTHFSAVADLAMAAAALAAAGGGRGKTHAGAIISSDHFYFKIPGQLEAMAAHGVLGVEMEAACLYGVAAEHGKGALAVLTVSDHLTKQGADMTAEERETVFQGALSLAVAAAFA
ncbi:MAG: DeoD-type purine-nucleoside phosphorylase [Propionibacteriaceae bacterium]|jgi:purine-nucleoside phosphorylase|nr:DeoD-type purine-nucleoside phosphorylase [Propionibacteriaceae bacterium]